MTSGNSSPCNNYWNGNEIELYRNNQLVFTFTRDFRDLQKCFDSDDIDQVNDVFKLEITGGNGVSSIYGGTIQKHTKNTSGLH